MNGKAVCHFKLNPLLTPPSRRPPHVDGHLRRCWTNDVLGGSSPSGKLTDTMSQIACWRPLEAWKNVEDWVVILKGMRCYIHLSGVANPKDLVILQINQRSSLNIQNVWI